MKMKANIASDQTVDVLSSKVRRIPSDIIQLLATATVLAVANGLYELKMHSVATKHQRRVSAVCVGCIACGEVAIDRRGGDGRGAGLDLSFAGSQGGYHCMWRCPRPGLNPSGLVNNSSLAAGPQFTEMKIL